MRGGGGGETTFNLPLLALLVALLRIFVSGFLFLLLVCESSFFVLLRLQVKGAPVDRAAVDITLHGLEFAAHSLHGVSEKTTQRARNDDSASEESNKDQGTKSKDEEQCD